MGVMFFHPFPVVVDYFARLGVATRNVTEFFVDVPV